MNSLEREQLACLESRLEQLEQKMAQAPGAHFPRAPLLLGSLLVVLVLSAASPGTSQDSLEQRVAQLEKMIRAGPGGVAQVLVPFEVLDRAGRAILRVSENPRTGGAGAAEFWRLPNGNGTGLMFSKGGRPVVTLATSHDGSGEVLAFSAKGKLGARVDADVGVIVYNDKEEQVSGLSPGPSGHGRVAVLKGGRAVVEITSDSAGNGFVNVLGAEGKIAVGMSGKRRSVGVANSQGKTVADLAVTPEGGGAFQVWGDGQRPLALLAHMVGRNAGTVQLSNGTRMFLALEAGVAGSGYLQLLNPSGEGVVEAGAGKEGVGVVRVGPKYRCKGSAPIPDCIVGRLQ